MYTGLKHLHYTLMVLLLIILFYTILRFVFNRMNDKPFENFEDKQTLITTILAHLQFLVGLVLLFVSPLSAMFSNMSAVMKDPDQRMILVEHPTTMLIAVVLLTIGRAKMKKKPEATNKYKTVIGFYVVALILILVRIPWDRING